MKIIIICITVIVLTILIVIYKRKSIFRIQNYQPFKNVWRDYNKDGKSYLTIAKNVLEDANNILLSKNIVMIPMYGTLLGMMRYNGLIPWDDDIDVCIPLDKFEDCKSLKDKLYEKGIGLVVIKSIFQPYIKYNHFFMKIFSLSEPNIKGENFSWPFIDIFGYQINENIVNIFDNSIPYKHSFKYDDIFPLHKFIFEDIEFQIPNNPENILNKLYTEGWKSSCLSASYNHRKEHAFKKVYTIKCEDLNFNIDDVFNNVWVINLDRRNDRWIRSEERLKEKGIIPKRWSAIDANSIEFLNKYNQIKGKKLSKGEVACYMSHKNLWTDIYKSNASSALIFEDDLIFAPQIGKEDIINAIKESNGYDIIYLGHCYASNKPFKNPIVKAGSAQCLHAYVIKRNAIEKILSQPDNFRLPIDKITEKLCKKNLCFISKHVEDNNTYGYGIIHQDNELGSDIINKTKTFLI